MISIHPLRESEERNLWTPASLIAYLRQNNITVDKEKNGLEPCLRTLQSIPKVKDFLMTVEDLKIIITADLDAIFLLCYTLGEIDPKKEWFQDKDLFKDIIQDKKLMLLAQFLYHDMLPQISKRGDILFLYQIEKILQNRRGELLDVLRTIREIDRVYASALSQKDVNALIGLQTEELRALNEKLRLSLVNIQQMSCRKRQDTIQQYIHSNNLEPAELEEGAIYPDPCLFATEREIEADPLLKLSVETDIDYAQSAKQGL